MGKRLVRLFLVALICQIAAGALLTNAALAAGAENRFVAPVMVVRKLSQPEIAAGPAKSIWSRPASVVSFVGFRGNGIPTQQTELRVAYDDTNLYLAFRCDEDQIKNLKAVHNTRDELTWRDDSLSAVLSPPNDGKTFFHFIGNVKASQYDERDKANGGVGWNGAWTFKFAQEDTYWTGLITVPFKDFGIAPPKAGTVWGGNFLRNELPTGEKSYWSPAAAGFQEPEQWGRIVFGDESAPIIAARMDVTGVPGPRQVAISASNPGKAALKLTLQPFAGDKAVGKTELSFAPGESQQKLSVAFAAEGTQHLSVAISDSSTGKDLFRSGQVAVKIPDNGSRIAKYRQLILAHNPATDKARQAKSAVLTELDAISKLAGDAKTDTAKWAELTRRLDAVELSVRGTRVLCADKKDQGYAVGVESALRKVLRDKLFEGRFDLPAKISACRNEFESVQVVVCAEDKAITGVEVSASQLTGPGGAVIPADRVQINPVEFVKTKQPKYEIDYVGWYPDPLMDNAPFEVAKDSLKPVWITVHVPSGIPAGDYTGTINIKPSNAPASSVALHVHVWNFDMPIEPTLKTAFAIFPHEVGAWNNGAPKDVGWRARYEFLLNHKINPTNIYTPSPLPQNNDIPFCVERGLNDMCLVYTHNKDEKGRAKLAAEIRPTLDLLKKNGWQDKGYFYGFDELGPDKYPELRDMYGWLKKEFPDVPRMCTVIPNPDLKGYVDIWVPVTSNWKQDVAEEYVKNGDEVWWYVCCNPQHPYANFFIDYPAIDPRIIFWQCWKYDVPGFLYYAINLWESNRIRGERWPKGEWDTFSFDGYNGDGNLVYPGPNGSLLSSIRFEAIRDGIEDYEYFSILEKLTNKAEFGVSDPKLVVDMKPLPKYNLALVGEARKVLAVRNEVVNSVTEYTMDPVVLMKARVEVAELIEKMEK